MTPPRERIIEVATRLFSALGYDGTSTRLIAETAGLNIATVAYHVGGKRELYLAVMERAHRAERAVLESALDAMTGDPDSIGRVVDRYLDFVLDNPEVSGLWMHRWLSDAADIAHLEGEYVQPLLLMVADRLRGTVPDDVDIEYAIRTVIWTTHGFCRGGVVGADGRRTGRDDAKETARFRAHLHQLVSRLLRIPD